MLSLLARRLATRISPRRRRRSRPSFSSLGRPEQLESRQLLAGDLTAEWIADDLLATLPDGGAITAWHDSVGGILASAGGTPALVPNQLGGRAVVRFDPGDGIDNLFVDSNVNPLSRANDFSVVVAFRSDSTNFEGGNGTWFTNTGLVDANQLGFGRDWGLSLNAQAQLSTGMGDGLASPSTTVYSGSSGLNDGQLHVAIVTRQGGTLTLYVDNAAPDQVTNGSTAPRGSLDMTFGTLTGGNRPFSGDLALVRLYDGELAPAEASAIREQVVAYYSNTPPTANDDSYNLTEDVLFFVGPGQPGVLQNDTDADGDPLTAVVVNGPRHGTLGLNSNGTFVYDPNDNYFGTDTFTYVAEDFRSSNIATVTLNIQSVYDPPQPAADTYRGRPGQVLQIPALVGVLANDRNVDQAPLTALLDQDVTGGELTLRNDGSFTYDPMDFAGTTSFRYRIDDGTGLTAPATVTLIINSAPEANPDDFTLGEDQVLSVDAAAGLLSNDLDAQPQDTLTVHLLEGPVHGILQLQPDGSFEYQPDEHYFGPDQFTYRVSDGNDTSNLATVRLTVQSRNDVPLSAADGYFMLPDRTLTVPADRGLLQNDSDVEGSPLAAAVVSAPRQGVLEMAADGSFTYRPFVGFTGTDRFTYRASDGDDSSPETVVEIEVSPRPVVISEVLTANSASVPTRLRSPGAARFLGDEALL